MAEKSYLIRIEGAETQEKRTTAKSSGGESVERKSGSKEKSLISKMAAYHYAKRAVQMVAGYEIGTIDIRTGSVLAQQEADFAYQIVNDVWNVGESIAVGAMAGGAPGAIVGAAIGTVFKVASYVENGAKINLQRSVESVTLAQNAIRIGAGGDRMGAVK